MYFAELASSLAEGKGACPQEVASAYTTSSYKRIAVSGLRLNSPHRLFIPVRLRLHIRSLGKRLSDSSIA